MPELSLIRKKEAVRAWNEGQLTDGQLIDLSVMYTDLIETLDAIGQTGSPMQVAARTRLNVVCDRAGVSESARERAFSDSDRVMDLQRWPEGTCPRCGATIVGTVTGPQEDKLLTHHEQWIMDQTTGDNWRYRKMRAEIERLRAALLSIAYYDDWTENDTAHAMMMLARGALSNEQITGASDK